MGMEIEVKLRGVDAEALRERLRAAGAAREGRVLEINRFYDFPDQRLRAAACGLRVRSQTALDGEAPAAGVLTFKGPRQPGPLKIREELETELGDPAALAQVLERMGLALTLEFEKRRETWRCGDGAVTLDELPRLGSFVEIEAGSEAAVEACRAQLGLQDATVEARSYVDLVVQELDATPSGGGVPRLTF